MLSPCFTWRLLPQRSFFPFPDLRTVFTHWKHFITPNRGHIDTNLKEEDKSNTSKQPLASNWDRIRDLRAAAFSHTTLPQNSGRTARSGILRASNGLFSPVPTGRLSGYFGAYN